MASTYISDGQQQRNQEKVLGLSPEEYTVGWICAIPVELQAARAMLDREHAPLQHQPSYDENSYILGSIGAHNVIIACLPEYGNHRAAIAAKSMQATFRSLRFGLMVGVGGGIPTAENDIRLGDLVVSKPTEQDGGVIQYDLGRREQDGFHRVGSLNKPPTLLRTTVVNLMSTRSLGKEISRFVNEVFQSEEFCEDPEEEWTYPVRAKDVLFKADYGHIDDNPNCDKCLEIAEASELVARHPRPNSNLRIHYGNIGSGNSVVKLAADRDHLAKRDNIMCFEMEAAGLMDDFPCLVIRGICDYADSHKNKKWQPYAAAVAAVYAKKFLAIIPPLALRRLEPAGNSLSVSQPVYLGPVNFTGESTARLVISSYDYSMIKHPAPIEFQDLGRSLTTSRREKAEDGTLHATARRLAAIFGPLLPQTPTLLKIYGLRASEIAKASTEDPPDGIGFLSQHVGIDGTSVWAGATSGVGAVQVHLLACMLARMWKGPEATSIWVELLESRQLEVTSQLESSGSIDFQTLAASKQQVDRNQLAEWDASARAWLSIADMSRSTQQRQLLLVLGNREGYINSKSVVYDSVIKTWITGLKTMESLLLGSPMVMQTGDLSLALTSWHIYPDLNILEPNNRIIRQRDQLVPESGILTIGLQGPEDSQNKGIRWSLPLAHLRYYGDPVQRTSTITSQGSRLSIMEFNMAVLGCVLEGWRVDDRDIESVAEWIKKLSSVVRAAFAELKIPVKETWIYYLGDTARTFLKSENLNRKVFMQLINLGRNNSHFLGRPSLPFFGLSDVNIAIKMARDTEEKIRILRTQANLAKLSWRHAIIRYIPNRIAGAEYASASLRERELPKRNSEGQVKANAGHARWIYSEPRGEQQSRADNANTSGLVGKDVFAGAPVPDTVRHRWLQSSTPQPQPATIQSVASLEPSSIFAHQRARYQKLGEEVNSAESEPLTTIEKLGKPMRVIWGDLGLHPHSTWDAYDHWFGEVKHYEHWLGDPESAAIFLRIDLVKPEGRARLPFAELKAFFDQDTFKAKQFLPILGEAVGLLETPYIGALQAFATMNSLYESSGRSTIDVRVLSRFLANSKWFKSLLLSDGSKTSADVDYRPCESDEGHMAEPEETNATSGGGLSPRLPLPNGFEDAIFFDDVAESQTILPQPRMGLWSKVSPEELSLQLKPRDMNTEQSFSCILWFENTFDIFPNQLKNVMAISSSNSLFIAASLLSDPAAPMQRKKIRHVMGNIGRPETALLVPPIQPRMMTPGIERWPELNFSAWDGIERDSFRNSSLHLWFTGSTQEVDIGFSGAQDKELYILESVVSLHGNSTWIADLDIVKVAQNQSLIHRHRPNLQSEKLLDGLDPWHVRSSSEPEMLQTCSAAHEKNYRYDKLPLAAIENWSELLENRNRSCIVLARGNWQARLAALMICVAQNRKVFLISRTVCWECVVAARRTRHDLDDPVVYIF